jgi:hypothetical protein
VYEDAGDPAGDPDQGIGGQRAAVSPRRQRGAAHVLHHEGHGAPFDQLDDLGDTRDAERFQLREDGVLVAQPSPLRIAEGALLDHHGESVHSPRGAAHGGRVGAMDLFADRVVG